MPLFGKRAKKSAEPTIVPFTSAQLSDAKHHGLRALSGLLMDRHSACTLCPFCGNPDDVMQLIVRVEMQTEATTGNPLLALYSCNATDPSDSHVDSIVEEWAPRLTYAEAVPSRKAVVQLLDNGAYYAEYGPIANPTKGDYSTGQLNREEWTLYFHCDPEPAYTRWQYWESSITHEQQIVPEFCCLRLRREWWIIDRDRERRMVQLVAAITVADSPNHSGDRKGYHVIVRER